MDKTGTLTKGHFAVQEVRPFQNLTSGGILALAAGAEQLSTHPIAASIVTAAKEKNLTFSLCTELEETAGEGLTCITEGQKAAVGNRRLMNRLGISLQSLPDASVGGTEVLLPERVLTGQILISDTVKPDAAAAVGQLTRMGLSAVMLTGDRPRAQKQCPGNRHFRRPGRTSSPGQAERNEPDPQQLRVSHVCGRRH